MVNGRQLLKPLLTFSRETEWIEFKENNSDPEMIGQRISALANSAALLQQSHAYFVWGIQDGSLSVVGTSLRPHAEKRGNEPLESWLAHNLAPCPDFRFQEETTESGARLVFLEIPAAAYQPVRFKDLAYIRVGETTKKLHDYPEKERALWKVFENTPYEKRIAMRAVPPDETLSLLDYDAYFRLTGQPLPETKRGILERLCQDRLAVSQGDSYDITNFGAILFARNLSRFGPLGRKAVRVIDYQRNDRVGGGREYVAEGGYAAAFEALIAYILSRFPNNEYIGQALRVQTEMYPQIAIRELVPNALIHQDLDVGGDSPFVEIFQDRIEITNPGRPLIDPLRFIDEPPQSRNEALAAFLRRVNICEERGSGIDKVVQAVEVYQLPPPEFSVTERHTRVYLYAHKSFSEMSSKERVRACYQHVCLMSVLSKPATNASLRTRFAFEAEDYKTVTKIISATLKEGLIKPYDPENRSPRYARYVPFWG